MPPPIPPCPAPPPSRLSRRDDPTAPLSSRMHSWKVDTTLRRRLEQRRVYSASQERGTEVGDHRALREMLPPSGGYGPDVPDPVALPAFVQRVGEWDGELKTFRTSLIQNRQREQRHPSSTVSTRQGGVQGVWAERIHDHHLLLKEEAATKRHTREKDDSPPTTPLNSEDNGTFLTSVVTDTPSLDPERPLYDSPAARAQRSKALRDRTLKSSLNRIRTVTAPTPQHLLDITSSPAEAKKVMSIPTVASKEGAAREFWYGGEVTPTPPAFDHTKEVEFQRLLQPAPRPHLPTRTPSATHTRGSREMFIRKRTKSHWYDFEGSQLAAHASHLLGSTPPSTSPHQAPQSPLLPSSVGARTAGRPPRVGPMSLTYPFPMF